MVETARAASKEGARRDPIRVGVIGSGSVAQKYIPHMQRMNIPRQRVDIAVVCDPDERQWDDARQRYGLDTFTTGLPRSSRRSRDRPRAGAHLDAAARRDRAGRARGRQARAGRKTDGDDAAGGRGAGRARGAQSRLSRLRAARRPQPDLSGDLAAPAAGRHRHGPQRARLLRLVRSELGSMVLSTRRRGDVRPRRLQRDHPHRSARPGEAGDGHERHRHPGAGGRRRADPGRTRTTTRTCCSTSAMPATPWSPPGSRCSATRCRASSSTAPRARSR